MPGSSAGLLTDSALLVIDSWPVMEWLKEREPTAELFEQILRSARDGDRLLLLSSINLGEIYYNCWNEWDRLRADEVLDGFSDLPIHVVHPTERDVIEAARVKGRYKISYADAFATVLALEYEAPVVSGDPDFLKLRTSGLIAVEWVGA